MRHPKTRAKASRKLPKRKAVRRRPSKRAPLAEVVARTVPATETDTVEAVSRSARD